MNWSILAAEETGVGTMAVWIVVAILALAAMLLLTLIARIFGLWIQALFAKAKVTIGQLIGMRMRKVDSRTIVLSKIQAVRAGLDVSTDQLESHYLAGGRVRNVVVALIMTNRANIRLDWKLATAIDLAGRDILDAVQTSVNPKVIDCPNPAGGKSTIEAVDKDGIQLKARARVTVRTNIDSLVGGATEETIIARVGQGIVTAIGSAASYKEVLEKPDRISRQVLDSGLDAGTAFEILSVDIANVEVGENVGAKLQADQAEADKRRFQAEAEKRRAMAMALEQEMQALVRENRAKVVLAEAEIPLAIQADTEMRENIAGGGAPGGKQDRP